MASLTICIRMDSIKGNIQNSIGILWVIWPMRWEILMRPLIIALIYKFLSTYCYLKIQTIWNLLVTTSQSWKLLKATMRKISTAIHFWKLSMKLLEGCPKLRGLQYLEKPYLLFHQDIIIRLILFGPSTSLNLIIAHWIRFRFLMETSMPIAWELNKNSMLRYSRLALTDSYRFLTSLKTMSTNHW